MVLLDPDSDTQRRRTASARRRRDAAVKTLTELGGIARVAALNDAAHSRRTLDVLRAEGRIVTVCRGWVALPGTAPELLEAARHGVVLSCVTQAKRLGLWVPHGLSDAEPHVAAPAHAGKAHLLTGRVHWGRPVIVRTPSAVVDPIENVLALVAMCQPYEDALATWESALAKKMFEPAALSRFDLPVEARRLLDDAALYADSGLETIVDLRLRWLGLPLRRQAMIAGHRVDLLIGDRLVLQIDGGHHVGAQRDEDNRHDAQLRLLGYHVIRVGYAQIHFRWHEVQDAVVHAIAQGLHRAA